MRKEALFLPKGSVRAILILFLTSAIIFLINKKVVIPEAIITIWASAMGWYFGSKINDIKNK